MARRIAVASQKGGVGKTTTVASLGVALAELGQRVLLVDLDPQACLTFSMGIDPETLETSVHQVIAGQLSARDAVIATDEGVDVLPSTIDLAQSEATLVGRSNAVFTLQRALAMIDDDYDVVLLDCPPTLGILTVNALTAAHEVLVPLQCETLAHRGVGQVIETVAEVQRVSNPGLVVLGFLPTMFDGRTTHAQAVLGDIGDRYQMPVLEPPIPRSVRFAEAPAIGRTVLSTAPALRGSEVYRLHARRLIGLATTDDSPVTQV
jgi:chromosome partitioning protein